HISGMTATSREDVGSAARRNPMVRIVVGHGTPNVGSRGKACPSARAIGGGYIRTYRIITNRSLTRSVWAGWRSPNPALRWVGAVALTLLCHDPLRPVRSRSVSHVPSACGRYRGGRIREHRRPGMDGDRQTGS